MGTAIQQFSFEDHEIRSQSVDGEPWFVGVDVCAALAIQNARRAISALTPDDVRSTYVIDAVGRQQETYIVNESGLYALIMRSRKPEAKRFQRWVTAEVLPTIRKTGGYSVEGRVSSNLDRAAEIVANIAQSLGTVAVRQEEVERRVIAIEERQKQVDPQEIERRMVELHRLKEELVGGTAGKDAPVTYPGFWRAVKEHVGVASFQNRAALTVPLMEKALEFARNWCFSRGVQPPDLFQSAA